MSRHQCVIQHALQETGAIAQYDEHQVLALTSQTVTPAEYFNSVDGGAAYLRDFDGLRLGQARVFFDDHFFGLFYVFFASRRVFSLFLVLFLKHLNTLLFYMLYCS